MTQNKSNAAGYAAGIAAGVSYGFNPLFAKQLLQDGVPVYTMLLYRYIIAAFCMCLWMIATKKNFHIEKRQIPILVLLGLLFASSSIGLFESYNYIPAGLATTLVYLYPVFTAVIMLFLKVKPSARVWTSIAGTLVGVLLICSPNGNITLNALGLGLAIFSAASYSIYLVIVNNARKISTVSSYAITFYGLIFGSLLFAIITTFRGEPVTGAIKGGLDWLCVLGLAVIPTLISMLTLAISTRKIGATKTAVLGVFEPKTAITIGILVFKESLTASIAVGVIICVCAVILLVTE